MMAHSLRKGCYGRLPVVVHGVLRPSPSQIGDLMLSEKRCHAEIGIKCVGDGGNFAEESPLSS